MENLIQVCVCKKAIQPEARWYPTFAWHGRASLDLTREVPQWDVLVGCGSKINGYPKIPTGKRKMVPESCGPRWGFLLDPWPVPPPVDQTHELVPLRAQPSTSSKAETCTWGWKQAAQFKWNSTLDTFNSFNHVLFYHLRPHHPHLSRFWAPECSRPLPFQAGSCHSPHHSR